MYQMNDNVYLLFCEIVQHQLSEHTKASKTMSSTEATRKKQIVIDIVCAKYNPLGQY